MAKQKPICDESTAAGRVAYNVRRLRAKGRLEVADCVEGTGISSAVWYRIEAGTAGSSRYEIIAEFFKIDVATLFRKPRTKRKG